MIESNNKYFKVDLLFLYNFKLKILRKDILQEFIQAEEKNLQIMEPLLNF